MREMKDSGYQWIEEIPVNWKITKLLYALRTPITDGPHETPILVDEGIPFISIDSLNDTEKIDLDVCKKFITKVLYDIYYKKAKLEKGDILFSKAATIGKTAIVGDEVFMVWSPLAIIKADYNIIDNRFLYHLLNCNELITNVSLMGSYSTQINVGMRELEKAIIPLPSLKEQKAIADFLDKKCSEIDFLTKDIEKQIEVLEEYKKSVITEAVTKGLDLNVEMKDSGSVWRKVPSNWNIARIDSLYVLRNEKVSDRDYQPLSVTKQGILPQLETAAKTDAHDSRKLVKKGDFAINSRSDRRGSCGISELDGSVSLINTVLKPRSNMNPRYYNWLFHTTEFGDEFYKWGHGIVDDLWTTNWKDMKVINIPQPPLKEQNAIADFLDKKCSEIDSLIIDKQKQLEILVDYKKSLIYEYVTGKKEVIA